ncbi:hypothetical protein PVAP13_1NG387219 [Panicum virgatum]|uniref:Uncharacterized protein n=1 Tax=Panicum virgatum TaxID=38727 RepID=A0A8T0X691_PANVG|nr:hypothetical protein PVAP13_1NG387219 [Panicum virgatum]
MTVPGPTNSNPAPPRPARWLDGTEWKEKDPEGDAPRGRRRWGESPTALPPKCGGRVLQNRVPRPWARAHSQREGAGRRPGRNRNRQRSCDGRSQAGRGSRARGGAAHTGSGRNGACRWRGRGAAAEPEPEGKKERKGSGPGGKTKQMLQRQWWY